MRTTKQWVVWKLEKRRDKQTKVPYNPHTGNHAESNNPATWHTFTTAIKAHSEGKYSGIGFMLADGFAGVDLDECRNAQTGKLDEWALRIVDQLASYTEVSPSGCGLHIFIKAKLPGDGLKRKVNGHKIEIYDTGRYFTFTGHHLEGTPPNVCKRQTEIESLYQHVLESTTKRKENPSLTSNRTHTTNSDSEIMDLAFNSRNGSKFERLWDGDTSNHASASEADAALVQILCFYSQDDAQVERLWLNSKLFRVKLERADYRKRTIQHARSRQTASYNPSTKARQSMPATLTDNGKQSCNESNKTTERDEADPPVSADPEREKYLRRLYANSSKFTRGRMLMVAALGFEKVPWRLLNAIHAYMRNSLGAKIITDEMLHKLYRQAGESATSTETVRRDKKKLWKAQQRAGIELVWYWAGRKNPATGECFGSRYQSHLDRWTLEAFDLAMNKKGSHFIMDHELKEACDEIASRIARNENIELPERVKDAFALEIEAEHSLERVASRFTEIWEDQDLTRGEKQIRTQKLLARFAAQLLEPDKSKRKRNERKLAAMMQAVLPETLKM